MFSSIIVLLAAGVTGSAGPSPPSTPPAAPPAAAASVKPTADDPGAKIECRRMDETGSRLGGKRVCMTRQEWADAAREARTMTEDVQNRGMGARVPGS